MASSIERSTGFKTMKERGLVVEGSYPDVTQLSDCDDLGNYHLIEVNPIVVGSIEPNTFVKPITIFEPKQSGENPNRDPNAIDEIRRN